MRIVHQQETGTVENKIRTSKSFFYSFRKRRKQGEATRKNNSEELPSKPLLFIDFQRKEKVFRFFSCSL